MNKILKTLFARIGAALRGCAAGLAARAGRIGKDKYQHFTVGALLAAVGFILPLMLGLPAGFALGYSVLSVLTAAAVKEYAIDSAPDRRDILATFAGGASVWVVAVVLIFIIP